MKKTLTLIKKMPIILGMVAAIAATNSVSTFAAENDYGNGICDHCRCYRPLVTVETQWISMIPCCGGDSGEVVEIQPIITCSLIEHLCDVCAKR